MFSIYTKTEKIINDCEITFVKHIIKHTDIFDNLEHVKVLVMVCVKTKQTDKIVVLLF